jgi:hypothetical protein
LRIIASEGITFQEDTSVEVFIFQKKKGEFSYIEVISDATEKNSNKIVAIANDAIGT